MRSDSTELDFYSTLLCSAALQLWRNKELPQTKGECSRMLGHPLTILIRQLLIATKLPLEQFYMALKIIQVLTASFPALTKLSNPGSEQRVFIAALIVANKYYEDHYISKRSWARVASMSLKELNKMELEILDGLRWNLEFSLPDYSTWINWTEELKLYWAQFFIRVQ